MQTVETNKKKVSISEKTHAKNQENVHIANTIIASIGAAFNPNNVLIKQNALSDFETGFTDRMQGVNAAFSAEQNAVGAQMAAFKLVSNRVSRTMKAAKGQSLAPDFLGHLQSTAYCLNGVKVNKNTPNEIQSGAQSHSSSRRSYAGILESLDLFDEQLKSNPNYNPNEDEYKTAIVSAWVQSLRDLHNAALDSKIATRAARSEHDSFAYNKTDGLIARITALKNYCDTILDKNDPRLKQLKKLRFVDYSK